MAKSPDFDFVEWPEAMVKIPFNSGGCSEQIARTAKPFVRVRHLVANTTQYVDASA